MGVMNIDEKSLREGLLSLVVALVEIIKETLRLEAVRRMEGGSLTAQEVDRLGEALMDLDTVIDKIKVDLGVMESVKAVRDGLDRAVEDALDTILNPARWDRANPTR